MGFFWEESFLGLGADLLGLLGEGEYRIFGRMKGLFFSIFFFFTFYCVQTRSAFFVSFSISPS
jgi:hypothetical protein